jgi:hypothetical protein
VPDQPIVLTPSAAHQDAQCPNMPTINPAQTLNPKL